MVIKYLHNLDCQIPTDLCLNHLSVEVHLPQFCSPKFPNYSSLISLNLEKEFLFLKISVHGSVCAPFIPPFRGPVTCK